MNKYEAILNETKKAVIGKDEQLEKILTAILATSCWRTSPA